MFQFLNINTKGQQNDTSQKIRGNTIKQTVFVAVCLMVLVTALIIVSFGNSADAQESNTPEIRYDLPQRHTGYSRQRK